jgi:hypothetical protein
MSRRKYKARPMIFTSRLKGALCSPEWACLTPVMHKHTRQKLWYEVIYYMIGVVFSAGKSGFHLGHK